MTTTALERRVRARKLVCGFCNSGNHKVCAGAVRNGVNSSRRLIVCPCTDERCEKNRTPHCLDCKRWVSEEDLDLVLWACVDKDVCKAHVEARLAANPLIQKIRTQEVKRKMSETTTEKKAKTPKVGKCVCCGGETKGGKFLPGHDARFVSKVVEGVTAGKESEDDARERVARETDSERLVAKFDRSMELANEKAAKKAKAAADKAASKAAPAEADVAEAEDDDEDVEPEPEPKAAPKRRGRKRS